MLVMGMNLGIQRDEEKRRKKEIVIGYLTDHLKVSLHYIQREINIHFQRGYSACIQLSKVVCIFKY